MSTVIERKLNTFFLWLMEESRNSKYHSEMRQGYACAGISWQCEGTGVEPYTRRVVEEGLSEIRINTTGLKLYITLKKPLNRVHIRIGGDQAKDYPTFVSAVKHKLIDEGLDEDTFYDEPKNPTVVRNISSWRNIN